MLSHKQRDVGDAVPYNQLGSLAETAHPGEGQAKGYAKSYDKSVKQKRTPSHIRSDVLFVFRWQKRFQRLLGLGSVHRANTGACAAVNAGGGIDDKLAIALGDRVHGAFALASAAADALFADKISHG
jgi:hypothetical protein